MFEVNFPSKIYQQEFANMQKTVIDGQIIVYKLKNIHKFTIPFSPEFGILSFCMHGWAKGTYNHHKAEVKAGDLCIIPTYTIVAFNEASEDYESFVVLFKSGSEIATILKCLCPVKNLIELYHRPVLTPKPQIWPVVDRSISLLDEISQNASIPNRLELLTNIFTMFYNLIYKSKLFEATNLIVKSRPEHIFEAFVNEVTQHVSISHKVAYYADLLCITPNYLSKVCRQIAHTSTQKIINKYIIMQSQYLLLNRKNMSIQEISEKVGFHNQAFFTNFFKREVGLSPSVYRHQH